MESCYTIRMKMITVLVASLVLITTASAQPAPPEPGFTSCTAVYGTIAQFSKDEATKQIWVKRSNQILRVALLYNPSAGEDAVAIIEQNLADIRAGVPHTAGRIIRTEQACRGFLAANGL